MTEPTLFDGPFLKEEDHNRLAKQLGRVRTLMLDGCWRSLQEIADSTGDPPASVSARLRDLRKPRFGNYTVDRKSCGKGLFLYRIPVPLID
jgi:hypothetical protein